MTKVISIGLDGAAWHKLDRLMEEGKLPNLSALVEQGARGTLNSVKPPVTCPAWRCSTSGKNPSKLGVFWWLTLDRETGEFFHPDSTSFDTVDIWDYLSDEGYRSGVINVPMTYPPMELDGTMVSGFGAPFVDQTDDDTSITYPASFQTELYDSYDWEIEVRDLTADDGPRRAYEVIESRFELLLDLLDDGYDYIQMVIFYINMLQHKYGDSDVTTEAWERIDSYLGELPTEDTLIVIYSDHGHSNIEQTFVINRWLKNRGYLSFADAEDDLVADTQTEGLSRRLIRSAGDTAETLVPNSVAKAVSPLYRKIVPPEHRGSMDVAESVNWDKSEAVATSQGPVYLNRERLGDQYDEVKESLKAELEALEYEGQKVLSSVEVAPSAYSGPYLDAAPDLLLTANDGWEIYGGLTDSVFVEQATSWTSGNHPEGIVLFAGDAVEPGTVPDASLLDVMPTILSYMGCSVPTDVDGEVIQAPFEEELTVETREPITKERHATTVDDHVRESLEDLGYLE